MSSVPHPTLSSVVEALLFASPDPLTTAALVRAIRAAAAAGRTTPPPGDPDSAPASDESGVSAEPTAVDPTAPPADLSETGAGPDAALPEMSESMPSTSTDETSDSLPDWRAVTEDDVRGAIERLQGEYDSSGRAFALAERASGWRIFTRPDFGPWVRGLFPQRRPQRLSQPALETLAIIAYRQPITRAAIEAVRGVTIDGPLQKLLDMNVVRIAGRAELPGRPLLYETTGLFFDHFGIRSVDDLPNSAELRRITLPQPDANPEPSPAASSAETPESAQPELPIAPGDAESTAAPTPRAD